MTALFNVQDGSHLSLDDIHAAFHAGTSVVRSAHVGNWDSRTLFLASEGFPVVVDEYARGDMSRYLPAFIKSGTKLIQIAPEPERPATHLEPADGSQRLHPALTHFQALQGLFGQTVQLVSDWLLRNPSLLHDVFSLLARHRPRSFHRLIDETGRVFELRACGDFENEYVAESESVRTVHHSTLASLTLESLQRVSAFFRGQIANVGEVMTVDVDTNIVLVTVSDIAQRHENVAGRQRGCEEVIHFSGIAMINYLLRSSGQAAIHQDNLRSIYSICAPAHARFGTDINLTIVPTDPIGNFLTDSEVDSLHLDLILRARDDVIVASQEAGEQWRPLMGRQRNALLVASISELSSEMLRMQELKLPKGVRDQVVKAIEGVSDGRPDPDLMFHIALKHRQHELGLDLRSEKLDGARQRLEHALRKVTGYRPAALSQHDLVHGATLGIPPRARELSQRELASRWRQIGRAL